MTARLHRALLCAMLMGAAAIAQAEPACVERYPTPAALASMFDVALTTTEQLDALDGVDVVLVARGGQDLSRYGLRHSHVAFLVREDDGQWRAVHLLNPCKTAQSHLFREGVATFIGETSSHTDLRIGVPTPALRDALKAMLTQPAIQARALHEARYSVVAYPFRTEYQNSNQWVLEVLGAAMAQVEEGTLIVNRTQAQAWLQRHRYTPSTLHIGVAKRLGARFFVPNAAVTDHPASERISGNYSVVTVESIFDFLQQRSSLQQELSVAHVPVAGITAPRP
ncbi:membrane protein [Stenotrophomonas rhizophila]|nr:membrane protein [Stenotrophomonas rhizophila]